MSDHTTGPWVVSSTFLVCTEAAQIIARCDPIGIPELDIPATQGAANARLIAAAPELLGVLQEIMEDRDAWIGLHSDLFTRTQAAIAKATGHK